MKLANIKDVNKFFDAVNRCEGKVELVSAQGDRLNLKSELTKYVAIANVFSNNKLVRELELVTYNPKDAVLLMEFVINQ